MELGAHTLHIIMSHELKLGLGIQVVGDRNQVWLQLGFDSATEIESEASRAVVYLSRQEKK